MKCYDNEGLALKMLEFIAAQDGEYKEERYMTEWGFAATVLTDFAKFLGVELIVPDYKRAIAGETK